MRGDLIPIQHADWNTDHLGTDHLRANPVTHTKPNTCTDAGPNGWPS